MQDGCIMQRYSMGVNDETEDLKFECLTGRETGDVLHCPVLHRVARCTDGILENIH